MPKSREIPFSQMQKISESGIFIKHFSQNGKTEMKAYAHRDDYYMVVLLTDGSAAVEVDYERKVLTPGDILIVSPWQVHNKPSGAEWQADGWLLAFSPEILSEAETRTIEEYSISSTPFNPGKNIVEDMATLCSMLERYESDVTVTVTLAAAIKSLVLSSLGSSAGKAPGRYRAITLRLQKLLDTHLRVKKSPAAYASMLNISEVYLNEAVKGATGLSVGAYIRSRVMLQARRQLSYTSLTSKEIAYNLGYDDYAFFSKLFRKCVGKSPSEYRKNLK